MDAFQGPGTPGSTGQPSTGGGGGLNRRDFLAAAGLGGAALVVPAIAIRSTRPAWLAGPGSSPSNADWNALRSQLSSHRLYRPGDRKSPRLNSSHPSISYAVFCLKKKSKPILHIRHIKKTIIKNAHKVKTTHT